MHLFELLAEPVRRRIVEVLASGEHTSGELASAVGHEFSVGRTAISHHLRVLREHEFVDVRDEGPVRVYRLAWNAVDRLELEVDHYRDLWDQRIGYPYRTDPVAPRRLGAIGGRGRRGRQHAADRSEVEIVPREELWWG
jgi:DNA-binding transcriptional ArsR family regulator